MNALPVDVRPDSFSHSILTVLKSGAEEGALKSKQEIGIVDLDIARSNEKNSMRLYNHRVAFTIASSILVLRSNLFHINPRGCHRSFFSLERHLLHNDRIHAKSCHEH
jgi:hypothetical protein